MSRDQLFEQLLLSLHDAAFDDARWPRASALIDELQGSKGNSLFSGDGGDDEPFITFFCRICDRGEHRPDRERKYFEVYHPIDERVPRMRLLPDSCITHVNELYDGLETKNSVVYNEWLPDSHASNCLHVRLDGPWGSRIIFVASDPVDDAGWTLERTETVARLLPHLRHLVRVRHALIGARALGASTTRLLENARCGIIHLDWRGRIGAANDLARQLLARGDSLTDAEGFLHALASHEDSTLQRLIARALSHFTSPPTGGSMVVSRRQVAPRLVLHVTPVRAHPGDVRPIQVAAVVLVIDPTWRAPLDPVLIEAALGFTPAQSQIAALLAEGRSIRDIAQATGRTEGTVRWHLKQINARHGISRQAQVVELVLSLSFMDRLGH